MDRLAPPPTDSTSSTPPVLRGRREVGPASTPSIVLNRQPSASFEAGGSDQLDVEELWRRTEGHDAFQSGVAGEEGARRRAGRSRRASSITSAALNPSSATSRRRLASSSSSGPSMLLVGLSLLVASFLLSTLGLYLVLFSSFIPPQTGLRWIDWVGEDEYWKYLVPLMVTVLTGWVIVNWGSLKILRHAQSRADGSTTTARAVPYDSPKLSRT